MQKLRAKLLTSAPTYPLVHSSTGSVNISTKISLHFLYKEVLSIFFIDVSHDNANETLMNNNSSNYATALEISTFCFVLGYDNVNETLMNNNSSNYATAFEISIFVSF